MIIRLLPSGIQSPGTFNFLTSFLIDDRVALDAGALGLLDPDSQARIKHVLLTHSHTDHIATLPIFIENASRRDDPVKLYGPAHTLEGLREHVFNDYIWPDLVVREPLVQLIAMSAEKPVTLGPLRVEPVLVNHTVPTFGYIVSGNGRSVAFTADTGPTERIWAVAKAHSDVRAVFVEASFPNELEEWAVKTGHLTPGLLARELEKAPPGVDVIVTTIKPQYRERVVRELAALDLPRLTIAEGGQEFVY